MTSSADVIVISSSPNPPRTPTRTAIDPDREFAISPQDETPPSLPSPSELLPLPSRSRFFPTPKATDDATKPKRRTTKKTTISDRNDKDASTKSSQRAKKATKEPKPKALGNVETDSLDSRIDASKKATVTAKGRPRKNAKSMGLGNMTLAGKVTKSSSEPQMKKTSEAEKTVQQKSPSGLSEQPGTKESRALNKEEELHLDKAMRRRVNWTPPEEDTPGEVLVVDDDDHLNQNDPHPITTGLGKLLSDYNYSGSGSEIRKLPANAIRGGLTKRRRIELVDPQIYHQTNKIASNEESSVQEGDSSSSSAKTKKKPKIQKRFTTLTARMTAQYATKEPEDDLMGDIVPDVGKPKSRRGKAKSTDKGHIFTVLSPEAAAKSLETQDLMFVSWKEKIPLKHLGRCSKLFASQKDFFSVEKEAGAVSGVVSRGAGERGLWSVGARDTEGSLIQAEPLDMVDLTSPFEAPQKKEFAIATIKAHAPAARGDDDWLDLDIEQPDTSPKKTTLQPEKRSTPVAKPKLATHAEPVVAPRGISAKVASHQRAESQQPSMPHYSGFTDAELSSQVASFGFKSVRGRKKMIELLQKCWESKHGSSVPVTLSQLPQVADSTQTATQTTINKPKAKAKSKQSTTMSTSKATTKKAELAAVSTPKKMQKRYTEIFSKTASSNREPSLDITTKSSQPQSPTKRRTTTAKSARTAKQVTTSISKADKVDSSKRSSLADLSMQITKAVRLQSQSSHPSTHASRLRPTWQEKIVMYDPIILEDLTAWLNVEGLALVGEDREVHTGVVRGWCESKGICCCWKKNARW
ncbi:hypothetical protein N7526_003821 [Penicillium atrosanguineum]|nr:hypothetical protein N7526_003821 [Penicillium atrosanguineum]